MSASDHTAMPIGAVAQLTGISSHTLRKWESRYGVIEPVRTDSGRRLYRQDQVAKLVLLRDLIDRGHQISQLSTLSLEELETLADQGTRELASAAPERLEFDEVLLVGQVLTAIFAAQLAKVPKEFALLPVAAGPWLEAAAGAGDTTAGGTNALVIELPTLGEEELRALLQLRQSRFSQILVVCGFTTRALAQRLANGDVQCVKAPVTAADILERLHRATSQLTVSDLLANGQVPEPRFSQESIAQVAALAPSINCECPNHIAQLLVGISAFEQYSQECEDTEPEERALHARLRLIAAQARALFEEGLANVAHAEDIPLEEL